MELAKHAGDTGSGGAIGGWTCNEPTEADPSCGAPDSKRMTISPIRINWPVLSFVSSTNSPSTKVPASSQGF